MHRCFVWVGAEEGAVLIEFAMVGFDGGGLLGGLWRGLVGGVVG